MSTDARIAVGLPRHPKTKKLIKRLGQGAAWNLVCLILWAASDRSDGDLSGMSDEDIELAADWIGDDGELVAALVDVRFLDGEQGAYVIHDWHEHNPWAAGADMRSAKARWNAAKRHHGAAEADRLVPEYAAIRNAASNADSTHAAQAQQLSSNAPSPSPSPSPSYEYKPRASRKPAADAAVSLSIADLVSEGVDERHAIDWMRVRKDKGAKSLTQTAWLAVKTEAAKIGLTPAQAVEMSASNSWRGFNASWVANQKQTGSGGQLERPLTPSERAAYASSPNLCNERVKRLMAQELQNKPTKVQDVIEMEAGNVIAIRMD